MQYHSSQRNIVFTVFFSILAALALNACGDTNNVSGPPTPVEPGPLTITSTSLEIGVIGQRYADTVGGSGGTTPYTWSVAPALPAGLSLNPTTGTITSTPLPTATSSQLHTFTLKDSSSPQEQVRKSLTLTVVNPPPVLAILTTSLPNVTVPDSYSKTLQAAGGTVPFTWSVIAGSLPPSFTLNTTTGEIAAPPTTVGAAGTYNFTIRVTDTAGQIDDQALSIRIVVVPPTITTTSLPGGTVGTAYSRTLLASGGTGTLAWSLGLGSLPANLSLSSAGVISGTPTGTGTANFTVKVTDSLSLSDTQALSITIVAAPVGPTITTTSLPGGTVGTAYSRTLLASGGTGTLAWSLDLGSLPANLSLSSAGVISGTPTGTGTANFTVKVTDSLSLSDTQALSITIVAAPVGPTITTTSLPGGTVGTAYSRTLLASGGTGTLAWSLGLGSLPANLSLSSAGVISGTPTGTGTANFTVKVTDSLSLSDAQALSITIVAAPVGPTITTTSLPGGTVGTAYSRTLLASGGTGTLAWSLDLGSLPANLSLSSAGVISGTPTGTGTANFTVKVTDSLSLSDTQALSITIVAAPVGPTIMTTTLPNGTVGTPYSETLAASGGTGTLAWSLDLGSLPANLSLSSAGVISGTPTGTGTANFTVKVTDSLSLSDAQLLSITIVAAPIAPTITTTTLPNGKVGTPYSETLAATGGTGTLTWSLLSGALPTGLDPIDPSTGVIAGMPTVADTFTFTPQVTDTIPLSDPAPPGLSITIDP